MKEVKQSSEKLEGQQLVLLSRSELAARWGCDKSTIYKLQCQGILNALYLSKRFVKYRLSDIIKIEEGRAVS